MFVAPSWLEGYLIQLGIFIIIPLIIAVSIGIVKWKKSKDKELGVIFFAIAFIVAAIVMYPLGCVYWFYAYEVPSVQEKIITVQGWEPKPGILVQDNGMMVIDNADKLLLVTSEGEGFFNNENFLFNKFNTRDIFNQLKVGGTYKIKYYGWRNGFNSGFPNILSVEQVVNETGAKDNRYGDYFGTKLASAY